MTEIQTRFKTERNVDILGLPFPAKRKLLPRWNDVIFLPQMTPELYLKSVAYENKERELRTRIRNWGIIGKRHNNQDLYTWDLLSFAVDCLNIPKPKRKIGRPPANISDQIKYAILKVYNKSTFRKIFSFSTIYANSGYTTKLLRRTSIDKVFIDEKYTPHLEEIYRNLSNLLIPFENSFAIDSTGFSNRYNSRWVQVRLDFQKHKAFSKLHIICGTHTHIITEVKVTDGKASDSPYLKELLGKTAERFKIKRFCADSGYLSRENVQAVEDVEARPLIMPKKNSVRASKGYPAWLRMMHVYEDNPARFHKEYHLRSNVETVFSMMKTTLLDGISGKTETSQKNELLIRVICHNISVIIDAIFRFGLDPYNPRKQPNKEV